MIYPKGSVWMHPNTHIIAEVVRGEVEFEGERYIVTSHYTAHYTSQRLTFNTVGEMGWRWPMLLEGPALEQLHRNQAEDDPSKWVKPEGLTLDQIASIKRGVEEAKAGLATPVDWAAFDALGPDEDES